ncbi:unnamed protein product, partial [Brenthis ino]
MAKIIVYNKTPNIYSHLLLFLAIIYSGRCNPLGQTAYCENQGVAPAYLAPSTTAVCENAPNFPYYGLNSLPLHLPYGPLLPNLGSATVCESQPNLGQLLLDPLLGSYGSCLSRPLPGLGQTTVCESSPNLGLPLLDPLLGSYGCYRSRPLPGFAQTNVCESTPNLGLPLLDPLFSSYPYLSRPCSGLGSTTVCDTANLGLGAYGLPRGPLPITVPGFY